MGGKWGRAFVAFVAAVGISGGAVTAGASVDDGSRPADVTMLEDVRERVAAADRSAGALPADRQLAEHVDALGGRAAAETSCYHRENTDTDEGFTADGAVYGAAFYCSDHSWAFGVTTYDVWDDDELWFVSVQLDTDRNKSTGCNGVDYAIGGLWDAGLVADLIRTPSCSTATWTELGAVYIGRAGASDFVGLAFANSRIGNPGAIDYWMTIESVYIGSDTDFMPNTGWKTLSGFKPAPPPTTTGGGKPSGYWMIDRSGNVYAFGAVGHYGNAPTSSAVDLEPTASGKGYWIVDESGNVYAFGDAAHRGGPAGQLAPGESVTSLSRTKSGKGYWVFTNRGRVFAFGDAVHRGDMSNVALNGPVLDSIPTPSGNGYYMVASDGGVFAFGDAAFYGSMGGRPLNAPVMSLVPDADGRGYWLVAYDGGIFAFSAPFRGSMGGAALNRPVTGMVRFGNGYLMVAEDGGIFNFSNKPFYGSLGSSPPPVPIVSVAGIG